MAKGNTCSQLTNAKKNKKDEFYTQISDIESEVKHYRPHFKGKTVLCNCDDPRKSMFFRFFAENFEFLGLKKLIATCYKSQDVDLFSCKSSEQAVYQIYLGDTNKNHRVDAEEISVKPLKGDGDFRSSECLELLKEADIVVTNPPFSLFREFVALLFEYQKKFLIIGNVNALKYKEIFPLVQSNQMWLGASIHSGDREFGVPDDYPLEASGSRVDDQGRKFIRVKGVRWFTNLEYKERHEDIPLFRPYSPEEFPKYDNYDAIEVSKTADIPCDYFGVMGVPITFLDRYNPEQFELIGHMDSHGKVPKGIPNEAPYLNGKWLFSRVLIRRRQPQSV